VKLVEGAVYEWGGDRGVSNCGHGAASPVKERGPGYVKKLESGVKKPD